MRPGNQRRCNRSSNLATVLPCQRPPRGVATFAWSVRQRSSRQAGGEARSRLAAASLHIDPPRACSPLPARYCRAEPRVLAAASARVPARRADPWRTTGMLSFVASCGRASAASARRLSSQLIALCQLGSESGTEVLRCGETTRWAQLRTCRRTRPIGLPIGDIQGVCRAMLQFVTRKNFQHGRELTPGSGQSA